MDTSRKSQMHLERNNSVSFVGHIPVFHVLLCFSFCESPLLLTQDTHDTSESSGWQGFPTLNNPLQQQLGVLQLNLVLTQYLEIVSDPTGMGSAPPRLLPPTSDASCKSQAPRFLTVSVQFSYKSEIRMTSSSGSINFLERLTELREMPIYVYQSIKGYDKGYR